MRVIGVPFNSAGRRDQEAEAPQALRGAGLLARLAEALGGGGRLDDVGDVADDALALVTGHRDPRSGLRSVAALESVTATARRRVAETIRDGERPLVLGGDCSVLPGCLRGAQDALGDDAVGLLFVDGHEDAWPPRDSATGEAADCELGLLLGRHREQLPEALRAELPVVDPRSVAVLGPRDGGELAGHGVESLAGSVALVPADELTADPDAPTRHATEAVTRLRRRVEHWWLHVDLDVLSTEALPAVDYPQPGGLAWDQLDDLVGAALREPGCIGMTVCIYDPDLDPTGEHGRRIVDHLAGAVAAATAAATATAGGRGASDG